MESFLIDPFMRKISEITYSGDYKEISKIIKCEHFTCAGFNKHGDTFFVDDEGMFKADRAFFQHPGYPQPLAGYGMVLGANSEGDSVAPSITLNDLRRDIKWYSEESISLLAAIGAFD
jgi:hypothetical protein